MILTLTPNPSLDRTVSLPGPLQRGAVQRLTGVVMEPGGKGVNVARVLSNAGRAATAVLPAAENDPILTALGALELPGLTVRSVPVAGPARINTAVTEPDGTTTKLNELGAGLSEEEIERRRAEEEARGEDAWTPHVDRPRKVSAALRAYAMLATSADLGAVRDLKRLGIK